MSDTVNDSVQVNDAAVVSAMIKDPEIRKLSPGSDEFKVAVEKLSTEKVPSEATAEAKGDDRASADTTDDSDSEPRKKSKGLEKRFSQLTSERDEANRKAAELEARLKALEAQRGVQEEPAAQPLTFKPDEFHKAKPDINSFPTYAEYHEALLDWRDEKKEWDLQQKQVIAKAQEIQKTVLTSWETREQATKNRVEGYDQLVDKDFITEFSTRVASKESLQFLLESEAGPDLLYELAEDDAKMAGFKSMSPVKQVAYLSKLEAKYEKSDEADSGKKSTASKAPAPSKPLPKGKSVVTGDISQGVRSFADYQAWRRNQTKR